MNEPNSHSVANQFAALTPWQQSEVLAFIRQLQSAPIAKPPLSKDERRKVILELAGSFSDDDIQAFKDAEAECERIDPDGW